MYTDSVQYLLSEECLGWKYKNIIDIKVKNI